MSGGGVAGRRVLVVDDDHELAGELAELLDAYGCEARVATSKEEARRLAREFGPDLALVDLWLGREKSLDLLREWRDSFPALKLVVVSGDVLSADDLALLGPDAPLAMRKPVDVARLLALFGFA